MNVFEASLFAHGALERGAAQKASELGPALEFLSDPARWRDGAPQTVLEIGTLRGGTLWAWSQIATEDAMIVSVDLPGGQWGGGYQESDIPRLESFVRPGQELHLVRGDSHAETTFYEVDALLEGRGVDLLFIDGDHSYKGVQADWLDYSPFVNCPGYAVLHDILPHPDVPGCDVDRFWGELSALHGQIGAAFEFCSPAETHPEWGQWGGIGVIAL